MARLRNAPSSQRCAPAKPATRQALKEKTNTAAATTTPGADEPKDFIKNARPTRARGRVKQAAQNEDELFMAGGLGPKSDTMQDKAPAGNAGGEKLHGNAKQGARTNRRPPRQTRKPAQSEAQSKVFEDMKKRMRTTADEVVGDPIAEVPAAQGPSSDALPTKLPAQTSSGHEAGRSEFSISPSPPPPGKLSAVKKRPSTARPNSVLKSQSTPTAETSVLALKNFKRRPRQPSMLAMVQQRTASARPSAADMQQAAELEPDDPSLFDIERSDEEEEEFAPDAEGTPLHLRKAKRTSRVSNRTASPAPSRLSANRTAAGSRKRKSEHVDILGSSLSSSKRKRRRSTMDEDDLQDVGAAQSPAREPDSERQEIPQPQATSEVQVINSSPSTTPPTESSSSDRRQQLSGAGVVVPSTEEQALRDELALNDNEDALPDETMADPVSSSPPPDEALAIQITDIMADPLTQLTPPPKRDARKAAKPRRVMTNTLQSLLPKRRQPPRPRQRKSEYDIDTESDEDDAGDTSGDEDVDSRRRRKTARPKPRASTATSKTQTTRKSTAAGKAGRNATAPAQGRKTAAAKKSMSKSGRAYGRNAASDKENDPTNSDFEELSENDDSALPDTSLTMHEAQEQSGELAAMKAKFAEVDGWDMEFESVSFEEGRSSSQTWR